MPALRYKLNDGSVDIIRKILENQAGSAALASGDSDHDFLRKVLTNQADAIDGFVGGGGSDFDGTITGLTGGTATDLDGIVTTALDTASTLRLIVVSGELQGWRLEAGTDAEDVINDIVRPDDYAATTNEKVWKRYL